METDSRSENAMLVYKFAMMQTLMQKLVENDGTLHPLYGFCPEARRKFATKMVLLQLPFDDRMKMTLFLQI